MQDLIASGGRWFDQVRKEHLSLEAHYYPSGSTTPFICRATPAIGRWEKLDGSGQVVRMETRDFIISRDEMPNDPKRGDTIVVIDSQARTTYRVLIPDGAQQAWRWCDRASTVRRIHTTEVERYTGV